MDVVVGVSVFVHKGMGVRKYKRLAVSGLAGSGIVKEKRTVRRKGYVHRGF